jgi:hypothetical protein
MDRVNPDWRERLRRELRLIDDPCWKALSLQLLSKEKRKSLPKTKTQSRVDAIAKETAQVAATGNVLPGFNDFSSGEYKPVPQLSRAIKGPPEEYAWTRDLRGYEAARGSAVNALQGLWAATHAAQAGYNSKTPLLDVFLFKIRTGRIKRSDPLIQKAINHADKHGYPGNIRERIAEEFHNAEKRVKREYCDFNVSASLFYDLNPFRTTLVAGWVGALFWLMPDRLIADFLLSKKCVPPTTRQAVSQAVKQMGLHKHERPIVKSISHGFQLTFIEGYPPKA